MNSNEYINFKGYKQCAAKNCNKEGTTLLEIRYIKKCGFFCSSCATEFKNLDLVTGEFHNAM